MHDPIAPSPSAVRLLDGMRRLAADLGAVAFRGAHQRFYVSPVLPTRPMTHDDLVRAWSSAVADMRAGRMTDRIDTYVHVPFCSQRCAYCIYYSVGGADRAVRARWLDRVLRELASFGRALAGQRVHTWYVGGGTPTVLDVAQLERLLDGMASAFPFHAGGERCFECNPLTAAPEKIRPFADRGFNRASFGVQTLDPGVLGAVNRGYQTREMVERTVASLHGHGFHVNVDLIHGLPGSGADALLASLAVLLDLGVQEVTIYALSPYTPAGAARPPGQAAATWSGTRERILEAAARAGRPARLTDTAIKVDPPPGPASPSRLQAEQAAAGRAWGYDDASADPFSLLAIGPTTRSAIHGRLDYACERYAPDTPFDPAAPVARGRDVPAFEERRRFVTRSLARTGAVGPRAYRERFGAEMASDFPIVRDLAAMGALDVSPDALRHATDDPVERFAAQACFVDEAMVRQVRLELDREADARAVRRVAVSAVGTRVVFAVGPAAAGSPAFHRRGAFLVRVEDSESLEPAARRVVTAFVRLFDRVVDEGGLADADALRDRIVARAAGLTLVSGTKGSGRQEPFAIEPVG
jgi:hypothetical protein